MICYNSHLRSVLLMPVSKLQQHSCINIAHGSGDILIPAQLSEERLNDLHMKTLAVGLLLEFIFQMKHDTSRLYCPAGQIKVSDMWLIDRHCILHFQIDDHAGFMLYIYAFSRRFYPKRLTVHSGYTYFCQYMFPGKRTHNLCAANAML